MPLRSKPLHKNVTAKSNTSDYIFLSTNGLSLCTEEEGPLPVGDAAHLQEGWARQDMQQGIPSKQGALGACGHPSLMLAPDLLKPTWYLGLTLQCQPFFSPPTPPLSLPNRTGDAGSTSTDPEKSFWLKEWKEGPSATPSHPPHSCDAAQLQHQYLEAS